MPASFGPEVLAFVQSHLSDYTIEEMAGEVNKRFGLSLTYQKMKAYYANHKLHSGKRAKKRSYLWDAELTEALLAIYKGTKYVDIVKGIKERTGRDVTVQQVKSYLHNNGLSTGRTGRFERGAAPMNKGKSWDEYMSPEGQENCRKTCYKPGGTPSNTAPIGSMSVTRDGYLVKKVSNEGLQRQRWQFMHRLVWEENFGPIPEGMIVGFKNGDKKDIRPENLFLLTMSENARLNQSGYRSQNGDVTEAGLATVRLQAAIREKKKNRREKNGLKNNN